MTKKRVLVAHPRVTGAGGGNGVAAWALQALCADFDVSLATLQPLDHDDINRAWGTSLRAGDVRVHVVPARYARLLRCMLDTRRTDGILSDNALRPIPRRADPL